MKKQFLSIATAFILLVACHNSGSSTIGEKDEAYSNSFNEHSSAEKTGKHGAPASHTSPASHAAPADHSEAKHQSDTTSQHTTDTTKAVH